MHHDEEGLRLLIDHFRAFYRSTYPEDIETLIRYFAVFGAGGFDIDTTIPIKRLIEEKILDEYGELYNRIHADLPDAKESVALLQAVAKGDRRIHSACRRARLGETRGGELVAHLRAAGFLDLEPSREAPPQKAYPGQKLKREISRHRISHKLRFRSPFLRFWFRFVSPNAARIERGMYESLFEQFDRQHTAFTGLVFEELSQLYLQHELGDDPFLRCGSYWDRHIELDILARAPEGGFVVGECKWTNTKMNRSELLKLEEKCALVGLEPQRIFLFAKRGFSNELLALEKETLRCVGADALGALLIEAD